MDNAEAFLVQLAGLAGRAAAHGEYVLAEKCQELIESQRERIAFVQAVVAHNKRGR